MRKGGFRTGLGKEFEGRKGTILRSRGSRTRKRADLGSFLKRKGVIVRKREEHLPLSKGGERGEPVQSLQGIASSPKERRKLRALFKKRRGDWGKKKLPNFDAGGGTPYGGEKRPGKARSRNP